MEKANILLTNYLFYLLFSAPLSLDAASSPVKGKKTKMSFKKNVQSFHCLVCSPLLYPLSADMQGERVTLRIPTPGKMS